MKKESWERGKGDAGEGGRGGREKSKVRGGGGKRNVLRNEKDPPTIARL